MKFYLNKSFEIIASVTDVEGATYICSMTDIKTDAMVEAIEVMNRVVSATLVLLDEKREQLDNPKPYGVN